MLVCCWSPKGGSGVSVFAAACALALARTGGGARLADLDGDQPPILGLPADPATGLREWLQVGVEAPADALDRLAVHGRARAHVAPGRPRRARRRRRPRPAPRWGSRCATHPTPTIVDVGVPSDPAARSVARGCRRECRRRCAAATSRCAARCACRSRRDATARVLIEEPGRALGHATSPTSSVFPVLATVAVRSSVARVIDAGVFPVAAARCVARSRRAKCSRASAARPGGARRVTLPLARVDHRARAIRCTGACCAVPFDPREVGRDELRARLDRVLRDEAPLCPPRTRRAVLDALVDDVGGLGPLERWLADPTVSEIMVNGPGRAYVERRGRLEPIELRARRGRDRTARRAGRRAARAAPRPRVAARRRPPRRRLAAARGAAAARARRAVPHDPALRRPDVALDAFGVDGAAAALVEAMVRGGWNLLVAGAHERGQDDVVQRARPGDRSAASASSRSRRRPSCRCRSRTSCASRRGRPTPRAWARCRCATWCATALRMRPDRLIVGEVRGGEALDMLQALNTGHDGSLSTVHANGPAAALARLETLALFGGVALPLPAVRAQIAAAIDAVVHVARGRDGRRRIVAVGEVDAAGRGAPRRVLLARTARAARCRVRDPARPARRAGVDLVEAWRAMTTLAVALSAAARRVARAPRAGATPSSTACAVPNRRVAGVAANPRSRACSTPRRSTRPPGRSSDVGARRVSSRASSAPRSACVSRSCAVLAVARRRPGRACTRCGTAGRARSRPRCPTRSNASRPSCARAAPSRRAIARLATDDGPLAGDFARVERSRPARRGASRTRCAAWAAERGPRRAPIGRGCARRRARQSAVAPPTRSTSLAASLRDRLAVVAEAHALSAQARYSALVVGHRPARLSRVLGASSTGVRPTRVARHEPRPALRDRRPRARRHGRVVDAPHPRERRSSTDRARRWRCVGSARGARRARARTAHRGRRAARARSGRSARTRRAVPCRASCAVHRASAPIVHRSWRVVGAPLRAPASAAGTTNGRAAELPVAVDLVGVAVGAGLHALPGGRARGALEPAARSPRVLDASCAARALGASFDVALRGAADGTPRAAAHRDAAHERAARIARGAGARSPRRKKCAPTCAAGPKLARARFRCACSSPSCSACCPRSRCSRSCRCCSTASRSDHDRNGRGPCIDDWR